MSEDDTAHEEPTRRDYMKYGGAVVGGGLLAGCSDLAGQSGGTPTGTGSYSATIEPVGEVTFESVPEEWVVHSFSMDVGIVCGTTDGIVETVGGASGFDLSFYQMLPDVEVPDITGMGGLRGQERSLNKEYIYEVDPDMIGIDPNWLIAFSSGSSSRTWYGISSAVTTGSWSSVVSSPGRR